MNINEYIEELASQFLYHSSEECHFASMLSFSNKVPRTMHYPCMALEIEDWSISGNNGNDFVTLETAIFFLSHVKDTGNTEHLRNAYAENFKNSIRVIKQIRKDADELKRPAEFFDTSSASAFRIEFKDAGLYGYAVSMTIHLPFDIIACHINNGVSL